MEQSIEHTSLSPLLGRARHYCALQEHCEQEVRRKLADWGATEVEADHVVDSLLDEGYLDEARYARAYCESKLLRQHWSRQRVAMQLRARRVADEVVRTAMSAISDEAYLQALQAEAEKKMRMLGGELDGDNRRRLMQFLLGRGYTMHEINQVINQLNTAQQ